jgi:glycosyltransferase involved in cell wall biosynthesis
MIEGGLRRQGLFKASCPGRPLVTVVTVIFNGERHLEATIQSVLDQTYDNVEYILIDGGSTDGTVDLLRRNEKFLDCWVSGPDLGIYDAMNKAVALATGDWINFMNVGDSFREHDVLQRVFADRSLTGVDILYGDVVRKFPEFEVFVQSGALKDLWKGMQFCHQSTFFAAAYHKAHLYDLSFRVAADFQLIYSAFKSGARFQSLGYAVSSYSVDGVSAINRDWMLLERREIVGNDISWAGYYYKYLLLRNWVRLTLVPNWFFHLMARLRWFD